MSNSNLASIKILSPNCTSPRKNVIDTITIHCMASNATVTELGNYFKGNVSASSNYGIDSSGAIGLYVEEINASWCSSNNVNDNRAITIEVANDVIGGNWHVSDSALRSLIELCIDICKRNNIPMLLWKNDKNLIGQIDKQNMTIHKWFANKACPGDYLLSKHDYIVNEVNKRLTNNIPSEWAKKAWEWGIKNNITDGTRPLDNATREEIITMLYRYSNILG